MNSIRATLKLCLVLFLLGVFPPPVHAQPQTLTGWFTFMVADYQTESGLTAETTYFLTEDSGEQHELLIDIDLMKPLGGPVALNRKRVTVEGEWEQSGPAAIEKFRVDFIEFATSPDEPAALDASPAGTALLQTTSQAAVTGSQAWVTILCRFGDATDVTPHPVSHYEKLTGAAYPGLEHYWKEVSYGNIPDLKGSRVVGWYNLPRPRSYYEYDRDGDGEKEHDTQRTLDDCTAVAEADVFFPNFWGINLVFNQDFLDADAALGGPTRLTKDGQTRFYGVTWLPEWTHENQGVWAHEMGHGFGLMHSWGLYGPDDPAFLSSKWDVMGGGHYPSPSSEWLLGVHPITYHKDFLGWIPADRKYVAAPNTTRTITLERLAQPGTEGYLMAQIPIGDSPTDFYTVETRRFAGYDDGIPDEAVVIYRVDTTLQDGLAQVVDPDNNGDPNDEGAMWTVGEIFTDLENNLQISIDAAWSTSYRVTINTDPTIFTTCVDFLPYSRHTFGPSRNAASVQIRAASNCQWSATSNAAWIRVTSGGSGSGNGSVGYTVAANTSLTVRTGTLTVAGWTFTVTQAGVNDDLFEDDMESGTDGWWASSCTLPENEDCSSNPYPWALTTASSHGGAHAWTDSPGGNYQNNVLSELYTPRIDLTEVESATLVFWERYDFASGDGGIVRVHYGDSKWGDIRRVVGRSSTPWRQVSLDLTPFVGQSITISFFMTTDASETADGWYIDDVAVFSTDFETAEPPPLPQATLENPASNSFQSGIAAISGWACEAQTITIELNGVPYRAGYPTTRTDTQGVCGDSDNGFSLLWNWNNLGPGEHTVRALIDGVEFANRTVRVTTFGEQVLRGVRGTYPLSDFPQTGDTTQVQWAESLQNFVIADGSAPGGGGHASVAGVNARLENPSLGSAQSGIAAISGWACEAGEIVIELNGVPYRAGYPTTRTDTQGVCGDSDNGFSLLWNWNNLGPGTHTVRALLDGVEFANTTVRVTTFGEPFRRGLSGTFPIPDFPRSGENKRLRWEESLQNFVIVP